MDHTLLFAAACEVNILFLLAMAAFYQSQRPETDSFKSIFQCTSFIDKHRFDTLEREREKMSSSDKKSRRRLRLSPDFGWGWKRKDYLWDGVSEAVADRDFGGEILPFNLFSHARFFSPYLDLSFDFHPPTFLPARINACGSLFQWSTWWRMTNSLCCSVCESKRTIKFVVTVITSALSLLTLSSLDDDIVSCPWNIGMNNFNVLHARDLSLEAGEDSVRWVEKWLSAPYRWSSF